MYYYNRYRANFDQSVCLRTRKTTFYSDEKDAFSWKTKRKEESVLELKKCNLITTFTSLYMS